jgi:hypothetical protein
MLDGIVDDRDYTWLCKVMGVNYTAKKKEEIKKLVYEVFNIPS